MTLLALSIRQPWAWAILHGGKRIENRDWTGFGPRGPLLLHVGKTCTRREYAEGAEAIADARAQLGLPPLEVPPLADLPRGGLVGVACVVGAARNPDDCVGYAVPGALGIHLADVRVLSFVSMSGALGLFSPPWRDDAARDEYTRAADELRLPPVACPGSGCAARIDPRHVGCPQCWRRVDRRLRDALWDALRRFGRDAPAYHQARTAAIAAMQTRRYR